MELKPCPFCLSEAVYSRQARYGVVPVRVCCNDCGALGPEKPTHEEAYDAWNKRDSRSQSWSI